MGLLSWLRPSVQPQPAAKPAERVRARIDIAETGDDYRHWANADWFSMDGALTAVRRRTIRNRARYEFLNNPYLAGIGDTVANDLIGTGPRLQLNTASPEADQIVERAFARWCDRVYFAEKLRTMRRSKLIDGEAFCQFVTNRAFPFDDVQLDLRLIEAEQIATPVGAYIPDTTPEGSVVDGLEFDDDGNVVAYKRLKYHPGSNWRISNFEWDRIEARYVIHWFKRLRPAQHRGLSEVASALRLFGDMRRYTSAVIAAAETAADFAAFLKTNAPAADVAEVDPWQSVEIQKRAMVTLPDQWEVQQLKAEQPTSSYRDFKREILNEVGRCIGLPYNMTALDSSDYNYSSGRLDDQLWRAAINVERHELRCNVLDRMFLAWADEAAQIGLIPQGAGRIADWAWTWAWDGKEHVDPLKEASATEIRLASHTTTLAAEYAKQGKDWAVQIAQRAKEIAVLREAGLLNEPMAPPTATPAQVEDDAEEDTGSDDEEAVQAAADSYTPTSEMAAEAARGLEWRRKFNRGGTEVGVARARDIANRRSLSAETVLRMRSYFARHEVDKQGEGWSPSDKGYPSAGRIAWALWGGDAGRAWANKLSRKLEEADA